MTLSLLLLSGLLAACGKSGAVAVPVDTAEDTTPASDTDPPDTAPTTDSAPTGIDDTAGTVDTSGGADDTDSADSADTDDTVDDVGSPAELAIVFDPPGGGFSGSLTLTLSAEDADADIRYTLDGSLPTDDSGLIYAGPITLTEGAEVRAFARGELGTGDVAAAAYARLASDVADFTSNLPVLILQTDGVAPTSDSGGYTDFTLNVFEPPEGGRTELLGDAHLSTRAGLKVRGSSSAGYPKKPYSLETVEPGSDDDMSVELLGMPAEGDWVLYAPLDFDRAFVRNALMYALSNEIERYAPRTRFVEVFVADRGRDVTMDHYVGVYVVMERIERDGDRVDVTRLSADDVAEPEVTGGYIFKRDRLGSGESGFTAGAAFGSFDFDQPLVYVYPEEEDIVSEQAAYLSDTLNAFGLALAEDDFTHPSTGLHYSAYIDVDSWIDHHILNVLSKNPDAFRLSGYFHKDREGLVMSGPVWDFDRTMGCASDDRAEDPENWDATNQTWDTTDVFDHGWWRGLFADPEFREAYKARWLALLDGPLGVDNTHALVDAMTAELVEASERNFDRWDDYGPRMGGYSGEVLLLKSWLADRDEWIRDCLNSDTLDYRSCGR